jgi:hypothetical protein
VEGIAADASELRALTDAAGSLVANMVSYYGIGPFCKNAPLRPGKKNKLTKHIPVKEYTA